MRESVKMPKLIAQVGEDEALAHEPGEGFDLGGTVSTAESLLWIRAPALVNLEIEQLYRSEMAELQKWELLRMQRAIFGGENLALWERNETGGDLFSEAQSESCFVAANTFDLRVSSSGNGNAQSSSLVAPSYDFTGWLPHVVSSPTSAFSLTRSSESVQPRSGDFGTLRFASSGQAALAREPRRRAMLASVQSAFAGGSASLAARAANSPLPIETVKFEKVAQKDWGPTRNVLAVGNYILTADRSLASLKLDGVGEGWDREGYDLGREINLNAHRLTLTGAGILSIGEKRDKIWNGTLATTRDNFEVHVTGGGPGYGGLEIGAVMVNGPNGATGLIKTGDGELILSNQQKNTFLGEVRVDRGTLTLRSKDGAIAAKTIFVGDGSGPAILNLKGGRDHINPEATVTLRGGDEGQAAVLRFEKTHPKKGVVQTLEKLVIEGSGVIEFIDPFITDGKGTSPNKNALYIDELDLRGELTIRGWEEHDTQIFIKRSVQPDEEFLSKIYVEGHTNLRVSQAKDGYWSLEAAPIPEPALCGSIVASGLCSLAIWRRRWWLRSLRTRGRK